MASSSCFLRAAFGFVAGSTIGYFGHDSIQKASHNLLKNSDTSDDEYWRLPKLPLIKAVKPWDDNWDRRDPKSLVQYKKKEQGKLNGMKSDENNNQLSEEDEIKKYTPKATRHLLLIRHGQYVTDALTDESRMLTPLGVDQGDMTGRRLLEMNLPYTVLIKSTMQRARETAAAIQKYLPNVPVVECDLLREGAPWPPEPPLSSWKPDYKWFQDSARIEAAFRKYFHRADYKQKEDSYEVIVCHANVIRFFVCRALQLPPEAWLRLSLNHGSITWVTIRPSGRVTLRGLGDSGYMPFDKVTVYN